MTKPAAALGIQPEEAERTAAIVAQLLPPALVPVFSARFARSHLLYDEFVHRLAVRVFVSAGLAAAAHTWTRAPEAAARAGLAVERALLAVDWMLRHLASRGLLAREEDDGRPRFRAESPLPEPDPAAVLAEQRRHDPACLPSYALAETAARDYGAFLRGERTGEEILLAPARLPLWAGYFSNDNLLYAVNNRVGAAALEAWLRPGGGAILELGGGLGSGTAAVLEALGAAGRLDEIASYRVTELVPAFLRRAQRFLQERFREMHGLAFAPLDMNRPFAEQGVTAASTSVVYAVNTLHAAHDLAFTLGEVRRALAPLGQLIISECIRPRPDDTIYPEFVFNLMEAFRAARLDPVWRPNGGFLTPEQWSAALEAAGFADVRTMPDVARIRAVFPTFYVAAIGATRPA
jgi:SAM-dependent methyltransferase